MFVCMWEGGVGGGSPSANCFQRVLRAGVLEYSVLLYSDPSMGAGYGQEKCRFLELA